MTRARMADTASAPAPEGRSAFLSGLSPFSRRLILIGTALALAIVLGTSLLGWLLRRDAQQNAEREISGLSILIAEQTARAVQSVDLQIKELRDRVTQLRPTDEAEFRALLGTRAVHEELLARTLNLPQSSGIIIVDARGRLVNFNHFWPVQDTDLSDRDYYRHFMDHPADDGVYVSLPVRNHFDQTWTFYLARQVTTVDGKRAGLIVGAMDVGYYSSLYASIGLTEGSLITLLRQDGVVMAEYPERPGIIGNRLPAKSDWYHLSQNDSAHYRFIAPFGGGAPLFVALKHVRGYGLVINVAISEPYVLAEWRRLVTLLALGSGPGLMVMFGLLCALVVQFRRIELAEAAARQRNEELEDTRNTLEATLENMEEGLIMIAADDRLAVCNRRAQEILHISDAMLRQQPILKGMTARTSCVGEFDGITPDLRGLIDHDDDVDTPRNFEQLRPDGSVIEVRTVPLSGGGIVRTFTDITERRRAEDRVRHIAHHDELTGLPNRVLLHERLATALQNARLHSDGVGVLFLDLDRFKTVNDTRGHQVGDQLLVEVAARLAQLVRGNDTVARMGGDEFVVVIAALHGRESAAALALRMVEAIGQPFEIGGHELSIGLSVGLALFPGDGDGADELLRKADLALYRAKTGGRNTMCSFDPAAEANRILRTELEEELRLGLRLGQFCVDYQPIWDLRQDRVSGMEALVRWDHPVRGRIPPAEFIAVAEDIGLIGNLGQWVLETACIEAAAWPHSVRVAVNISPLQLRRPDFPMQVSAALLASGLSPERLELEITEGVLLEDTPGLAATLAGFEVKGIRMVLDDFGTDHSSLSYLRRCRFAKLKIDRSFIRHICDDTESALLLQAILQIGRALKLDVVAEGVETNAQLEMLRDCGCGYAQGYLLGHPASSGSTRGLLRVSAQAAEVVS